MKKLLLAAVAAVGMLLPTSMSANASTLGDLLSGVAGSYMGNGYGYGAGGYGYGYDPYSSYAAGYPGTTGSGILGSLLGGATGYGAPYADPYAGGLPYNPYAPNPYLNQYAYNQQPYFNNAYGYQNYGPPYGNAYGYHRHHHHHGGNGQHVDYDNDGD